MTRRALAAALCAWSLLSACGSGDAEPAARNLVLITLDTTRRDALGCFDGPEGVTPNLDALCAEGVAYDLARTVAPLTLPSHASMLTGLYPPRHTVRDNNLTPVPASAVTLAERASDAGMRTGAVVAAAVLAPVFGLAQGFEAYNAPAREGHGFAARRADEVAAEAVAWLTDVDPDERYFLWAHWFDPHKPLNPGEPFLAQAGGDPYLGSVAEMDAGVGTLLDALRARPDWEDTLVVVVGDHGEGNGQHGEATHGTFVYDTTLRVPLIVRRPGGEQAGTRSSAVTSVVDVFSTAIDQLELGSPGDVDGRSLARDIGPERGVYFEALYGAVYHQWSPLYGWADAEAKYVHASTPELYRTATDPGEVRNALAESDAAPYLDALAAVTRAEPLALGAEAIDESYLEALQALGYAGGAAAVEVPGPFEVPADRPSPHDRAEELEWIVLSYNLSSGGRLDEAEKVLLRIVELNPRNHDAWSRIGRIRVGRGDWAGAAEALERFEAIGPPWPDALFNLALCYRNLERPGDAVRLGAKGLEHDPENRAALAMMVELLTELDRGAEAAAYLERLEELR